MLRFNCPQNGGVKKHENQHIFDELRGTVDQASVGKRVFLTLDAQLGYADHHTSFVARISSMTPVPRTALYSRCFQ